MMITTSTPALINSFKNSKKWKLIRRGRIKPNKTLDKNLRKTASVKRITTSWKYVN